MLLFGLLIWYNQYNHMGFFRALDLAKDSIMYSYLFKHTASVHDHTDPETKKIYLNKGISYPNNENSVYSPFKLF